MVLATLLDLELTAAEEFMVALCIVEGTPIQTLALSPYLRGRIGRAISGIEKLPRSWRFEISAAILQGGRRGAPQS